jgi:phage repressor protein C with HTH and peptisase S24 domain
LKKLAEILDTPLAVLTEESLPATNVESGPSALSNVSALASDVPVFGTAVGGHDGDFAFNGQVVDYVRRPPGVAKLRNIYALWVTGDSMAPWNSSGDLIYVTPSRPPVTGDHVVVELIGENDHEPGTAMVKLLTGRTTTHLKLKQYNPESEFMVPLSRVKAVHKVLTLRDLLGV